MNSNALLSLAEAYCRHRRLSLGSLGTYATKDARFFRKLPEGRVTIRRAERVLQWLSDHWPADLPWPADIPRTAPSAGEPAGKAA